MRRALRWLLLGLLALVLAVAAILVGRALALPSAQIEGDPEPAPPFDAPAAVEHLAAALRLPTVSPQDPADFQGAPFRALHDLLRVAYPCFHRSARREVIAEYSLLYTWEGRDDRLPPALFLGHLDVVPADGTWTHPPFAGVIAEGAVWGRGAIDDKGGVIALLEAAEALCVAGTRPTRPLLFAFGHDEENGGTAGATALAAALAARGARPVAIFDEGMVITEGVYAGLDAPLALIGVAEKGYLTLRLTVTSPGGHTMAPPKTSAAARLAAAAARIEAEPFPLRIASPVREMLEAIAPELPLARRLPLANLWLFEPLVIATMAAEDRPRALLQTSAAVTLLRAGAKENVLPTEAEALINLRIAPGSSVAEVLEQVRARVADPAVAVEIHRVSPPVEPSPITPLDAPGYRWIARAVRGALPNAVVAPALVLGGTDSKHFLSLQTIPPPVLRFRPVALGPADIATIHGVDERVRIDAFTRAIAIDAAILRAAAAGE